MKVDNNPGKKKISAFGSEGNFLAQLIGQGEATKVALGENESSVVPGVVEEEEISLCTRGH